MPDITFGGVQMANRVDGNEGLPAMNWWRIQTIVTETGGSITVEYSPQDCAPGNVPAALHDNHRRCYPVRWTPDGYPDPITDFFHKYVVVRVSNEDPTGASNRSITRYEYAGDPAWHYTDDDGLIKAENKTWSGWRGYGTVRTKVGDPGEQTSSEARYFRGMHGDKQPSGTRTVTLPAVGAAQAVNDEDHFAGMVRETITYNGPGGSEVSGTVSEPWRSDPPTATRTLHGTTVDARFVKTAGTWMRTVLDGGRPARVTHMRTSFGGHGLVTMVEDHGDTALTGDESCTLTEYASNIGAWLIAYPSRERVYAVDCNSATSGGLTEAHVIADQRLSYDQQSHGSSPTKGLVSRVESVKTWSTATQTPGYLTIAMASHDSYGRVTQATDVRNNNKSTIYVHNAGGQVSAVTETNHLGWQSTTTLEPAWGAALSSVDPNARRTELVYDALGRVTAVWMPGRDRAAGLPATTTYEYNIRNGAPSSVTMSKLAPNNNYVTTYALFDALMRPRQVQAPEAGAGGGRILTDTFYDSAGRAAKSFGPYVADGAPSASLFPPGGENTIATVATNVFDGVGRVSASILSSYGAEKWRTSVGYGGDRVDVTPPAGGTASSSVDDVHGRTVALRQYHGSTPSGGYDETTYTYNNKGQLARVTDPAGNHWDYAYDLIGRQVQADDPDNGRTTMAYNDANDVTSTTDARNVTIAYLYDSLGRRTSIRSGSPSGARLAEWTYDTLTGGTVVRGQPVKATRYVGSDGYATEILGYAADYQPTSIAYTIPAAEVGLAGTYTYNLSYRPNGALATVRLPDLDGAGGLAAETLTYAYTTAGDPYTVKTNYAGVTANYVASTTYTRFGELAVTTLQNGTSKGVQIGNYYQDGTRRLDRVWTTRETAPSTVADQYYTFRPDGHVEKISDVTSGDHQCFAHDYLGRLKEAWTPANADCDPAPTSGALGGPAKYWQKWAFNAVGNRVSQDAYNSSTGSMDTTTYSYPAAGSGQPHTLRSTSGARTGSYTYDAAGNTLTRPGPGGGVQSLTWTQDGRLANTTEGSSQVNFVYGADGGRLVRRESTGKTLYLPGQELHYSSAGARTTTRYYSHAGMTVAMRAASGVSWLIGDHQGTTERSVAASTQVVTTRRQTPYGAARGTQPPWPNDKGFLGGTRDSTGLTHLGAREYDTEIGRFISVDPLMDLSDSQQMNGYAYGNNSPVTISDPSGLMGLNNLIWDDGGNCQTLNLPNCTSEEDYADPPTTWNRRPPMTKHDYLDLCGMADPTGVCDAVNVTLYLDEGDYKGAAIASVGFIPLVGNFICKVGKWCAKVLDAVFTAARRGDGALHTAGSAMSDSLKQIADEAHDLWNNRKPGRPPSTPARPSEPTTPTSPRDCKNSFVPGTPVLMADGSQKPIEEIEEGDEVVATDPETGKTSAKTVDAAIIGSGDKQLVEIVVDGGDGDAATITATHDHPFWVDDKVGWFDAEQLAPGDTLLAPDGSRVRVLAVAAYGAVATVHNLTVADIHTYYVVAGNTPVLVHNCGTGEIPTPGAADGPHVAMGLTTIRNADLQVPNHLADFAAERGATTWQDPQFADIFSRPAATNEADFITRIVDGGGRISFSMRGIQNVDGMVAGTMNRYRTGAELHFICGNAAARAITTFFHGPSPC